jgi:hypothetical protein
LRGSRCIWYTVHHGRAGTAPFGLLVFNELPGGGSSGSIAGEWATDDPRRCGDSLCRPGCLDPAEDPPAEPNSHQNQRAARSHFRCTFPNRQPGRPSRSLGRRTSEGCTGCIFSSSNAPSEYGNSTSIVRLGDSETDATERTVSQAAFESTERFLPIGSGAIDGNVQGQERGHRVHRHCRR